MDAAFVATGTGFRYVALGRGFLYEGIVETATATHQGTDITMSNMNLDMVMLFTILFAESNQTDVLALENIMFQQDWEITLSNNADIASAGSIVADGAVFNLRDDDVIRGIGGDDRDFLNGGLAHDSLYGANGWDQLSGHQGNDLLVGGTGNDDFIFRDGDGHDAIRDFDANSNAEDIILRGVTEITSYDDLVTNHMTQDGTDVVINDDDQAAECVAVGAERRRLYLLGATRHILFLRPPREDRPRFSIEGYFHGETLGHYLRQGFADRCHPQPDKQNISRSGFS